MKEDEVKVSKIEVKMGDTKISLTPAQAKKLHAVLDEMFGNDNTVAREYIYTRPWWSWGPGYVYCAGGSSTGGSNSVTYTASGGALSVDIGAN